MFFIGSISGMLVVVQLLLLLLLLMVMMMVVMMLMILVLTGRVFFVGSVKDFLLFGLQIVEASREVIVDLEVFGGRTRVVRWIFEDLRVESVDEHLRLTYFGFDVNEFVFLFGV